MPVIPTGWAQAAIRFEGLNAPNGAAIVTGVENAGGYTAIQLGSYLYEAFGDATVQMCTSDIRMVAVDVKLGPNDTGPIATYTATPAVGAVGATSLSPGTAVLVHKNTLFGGRRSRGRMFWPGVLDGWANDSGGLEAGIQALVNGYMLQMYDLLEGYQIWLSLLHTPSYTWEISDTGQPRRVYAPDFSVPVPYRVDSLVCDATIATQRRRLR